LEGRVIACFLTFLSGIAVGVLGVALGLERGWWIIKGGR
jgi:hypothetical protein